MTAARRQRLQDRLGGLDVVALLVTAPADVRYLCGFTGSTASLLLPTDGEATLVVDGRYVEQAAGQAPDVQRRTGRGLDWIADAAPVGRLGVDGTQLSWVAARGLQDELGAGRVTDVGGVVAELRRVKDEEEQTLVARACAVTDAAFVAMATWLRPGLSEREVARRLEAELVDRGADEPAFATIVASGPAGARPHHAPDDRRLAVGDLVTVDAGARVDGYCADMTRTVAVGDPGTELRALYRLVHEAQAAGVAAAVEGATAGEVDDACRTPLLDAGHEQHIAHPSGHGLGLQIHEQPILRTGTADTLAAGMTVTVEPGLYVPGLGGVRIEDTLLVRPGGEPPRSLTTTTRDMLTVA